MTSAGISMLRVRAVPASRFPLQVLRSDGMPEVPLTVFADEWRKTLSPGSA